MNHKVVQKCGHRAQGVACFPNAHIDAWRKGSVLVGFFLRIWSIVGAFELSADMSSKFKCILVDRTMRHLG